MFTAVFPERPLVVIREAGHVISEVHQGPGFMDVVRGYEIDDLRAKLSRHHGDKTNTMFRGWADAWLSPEMRDWQMIDRLPAIRCPLLVIWGEGDEHGSAVHVDLILKRVGGPVETFWIPGCEHSPHVEGPDLMLERVAAFLAPILQGDRLSPARSEA
jgi:pimeloyl-ACP methyl ester carboxylesterase